MVKMNRGIRKSALFAVIIAVLFLGLNANGATAGAKIKNSDSVCSGVANEDKADCGFNGVTADSCAAAGCCWTEVNDKITPWCFYPSELVSAGYALSGMVETATGYAGTLQLQGNGSNYAYGPDIAQLNLEVVFETADIVRVKITDAAAARWEVPESVIPRPHAEAKPSAQNFDFTYSTEAPFSFEVTRKSDGRSLFKLDGSSFIYKDQFLQVSTAIDSTAKTFGLGESTRLNHALESGTTYTLWAMDLAAAAFNANLYSSFPYYLQMVDGAAHGAMLLNSNGMDVVLEESALTFKTIGGIIDLYVFAGPSPAEVVQQYTSIVGKPAMVPYWSLGFHNCKYGYTSVAQVEEVVANYSAAGIPLDTQWMDIDYMQNYRDFTLDAVNFNQQEVASFVDSLHANGQHFVPIIDPGIMVYSGYDAYEEGVSKDLFVKDISGGYYLGQVWPGPTYFPDFLHPSAQEYWTDQLTAFYEMVPMDGLWIDMNEVSNFCNVDGTGQVCSNTAPKGCPAPGASQTDCCLVCTSVDGSNALDFPPYAIGSAYGKLSTKTMAMSATHYGNVSVYDAHNLYGLTEQIATNAALTAIRGKRPFLLSRSSFLSTGAHSAKWTGDNAATWDDLRSSIISIMDFNIFGVPMIGADICGFIDDTTEELCARWIEVGAFYPFSRDHNALGAAPQELYLWESVTAAAKNALGMRYQLLPYMYTLFYRAHTAGDMVVQALWVNFPSDAAALAVDQQFMLGSAVLVTPVVTQGATSVSGYFPQGLWYDFTTRALAIDASAGGVQRQLVTPLTAVNVHVRGGNVLPLQEAAMTTTAGRKTPFTLLAALCPGGKAFGELFWDDGEQLGLEEYLSVSYAVETAADGGAVHGSFSAVVTQKSSRDAAVSAADGVKVGSVVVAGQNLNQPSFAIMNGVPLKASQISFDEKLNVLTFSGLDVPIAEAITLQWK